MQISIWPGGLASNAKGTIDWAGGEIDWNGQDIQNNGYYYAQFESVEVKCFNAPSAPGTNKGKSYTYNDARGTNDTVVDGNKPTILKSLLGTGTNMTADYAKDATTQSSGVAAVPGLTGAGPGTDGRRPDEEGGESKKPNASPSEGSGNEVSEDGTVTGPEGGIVTGFSQGDGGESAQQTGAAGIVSVWGSALIAGLGLGFLGLL